MPENSREWGVTYNALRVYIRIVKQLSEQRLNAVEELLDTKAKKGARLCWIRWNPNAGYDIEDAREDIEWMLYEIKRLRRENAELQSFAESFRKMVERDVGTT